MAAHNFGLTLHVLHHILKQHGLLVERDGEGIDPAGGDDSIAMYRLIHKPRPLAGQRGRSLAISIAKSATRGTSSRDRIELAANPQPAMIQDAHAEPAVGHITNRSNTPIFAADRLAHALHEADAPHSAPDSLTRFNASSAISSRLKASSCLHPTKVT